MVADLKRPPPRGTKTLATKTPDGVVTGQRGLLTNSPAYPAGFGRAVANLMKALLISGGVDIMFDFQLGSVCSSLVKAAAKKAPRKRALSSTSEASRRKKAKRVPHGMK